ncbi:MAG: cold-shock protein, partial [Pseudomonadota bacterium]
MPSGTVKWFNPDKGFGFIRPEEGGDDIFVHITALKDAGFETLPDGQPVTYELVTDRRGRTSAGEIKLDGDLIEAPERPPRRDFGDRGGYRGGGGGYRDRDGGGGYRGGGGGYRDRDGGGGGYR